MAEKTIHKEAWGYAEYIMKTGVLAEKGKIACFDTSDGSLTAAGVATTLVPIGYFEETLTGDGVKKVIVQLFKEIWLHRFINAASVIVEADKGKLAYLTDGQTVTSVSTGRSAMGRIWKIETGGTVLINIDIG